ncbi:MAG: FxsA family protein [Actinomycetota bacterium]|nr:FxsA family protein [Actinomycetota bacterium]
MVLGGLFLLFLVVPFVELFIILQVGRAIGALNTIAVLVVVSVVGAWLVKREGLGVLRRARRRLDAGAVPGRELVDGVLILFAGALLLTPGFLTDLLGVLLLVPPVRGAIRVAVSRVLHRRVALGPPGGW